MQECCLINMVDRMMDTHKTSDPRTVHFLFLKLGAFRIATCAAMELNTWMLGRIFVDVSAQ